MVDLVKKIYSLLKLRNFSIEGFIRYLVMRMRRKEVIVVGSCTFCGNCCKNIHLRYEKGWIRTTSQFEELKVLNPEYARFVPVNHDNGELMRFSCSWLNGDLMCQDYRNRLPICRRYPSKSLYFCGGRMLGDCGYSFQEVVPFRRVLEQALTGEKGEKNTDS